MSAKSDRLVRDLAQLFAKYSLSDWQPVLDELRQANSQSRTKLAEAIESHARLAVQLKRKPRSAHSKKVKRTRVLFQAAPEHDAFQALQASLVNREILPTAQDLKAAAMSIGVKDQLPSDRRDAARVVIEYLQKLSPERLEKSLQILTRGIDRKRPDLESEFDRWVALIMRPRQTS